MAEPFETSLGERLAVELERAAGMLEELAVQLCMDPVVFERHAGPCQRFDEVTQVIGEIAKVLRCQGSSHEALTAIRLDTMRGRMIDAQ